MAGLVKRIGAKGVAVSLQVAILRVLSGHPQGWATVDAVSSDLRILSGSEDWNKRMKRLAAGAPDLDIFEQRLVVRDRGGWQLTDDGRAAFCSLEGLAASDLFSGSPPLADIAPTETRQPGNVVELERIRRQRRAPVALPRSA